MRTGVQACRPDELELLQQILDSILLILRQDSCSFNTMAFEEQVERSLMECAFVDLPDAGKTRRSVIASLMA